jgi:hypothetical protein
MDTRFWGPSGWRLLHLIAAANDTKPKEATVKVFKNDVIMVSGYQIDAKTGIEIC